MLGVKVKEGAREEGVAKRVEDPGKSREPWEREECAKEVGAWEKRRSMGRRDSSMSSKCRGQVVF